MNRIFLLSPANCGGTRARQVVSPDARFALAERLRSREGAQLGEVFAFVSGLYFRGKLAYARRFAAVPDPGKSVKMEIAAGAGARKQCPCSTSCRPRQAAVA